MSFTGRDTAFNETEITNDGFYPDLSLGEFNAQYRVQPDYGTELVQEMVLLAIIVIGSTLSAMRTDWEAAGAATLAEVVQPEVGEKKSFVQLYKRAVYSHAKALLIREFPTLTRRAEAANSGREAPETETYYLANSNHAVRMLMGKTRVAEVELL